MAGERDNSVDEKDKSLRDATGLGKETDGVMYPYPAPYVLAFIEDEFGALDNMAQYPTKHGYHFVLFLVALLELQKAGELGDVAAMSSRERRKACHEILVAKGLTTADILGAHGKAANEVFLNALGVKPKKSSGQPSSQKKKSPKKEK